MSHSFKYYTRGPSSISDMKYKEIHALHLIASKPHYGLNVEYTHSNKWDKLSKSYNMESLTVLSDYGETKIKLSENCLECTEYITYTGIILMTRIQLLGLLKANERKEEEKKSWLLKILEQVLQRK